MEKPLSRKRQQQGVGVGVGVGVRVRGSKDSRLGVVLALAAAPDVARREAASCARISEVAAKREFTSCAPKSEVVPARVGGTCAPKPEVVPAKEDDSYAPKSEVGPATESASYDFKSEIAPAIVGGSCAPKPEVTAARETRSRASKREVVADRETRGSAPKPEVVAAREAGSSSPKSEVVAATEAGRSAPKSEVVAARVAVSSAPEWEVVAAREAVSSAPESEVVAAREAESIAPESEVVAAREAVSSAPESEVVAAREAESSAPKSEAVEVREGGSSAPNSGVAAVVTGTAVLKKKRGRPAKGAPKSVTAAATPPLRQKKEKEEEDVCFICFDGGSLVLCDRRGCPKAYHPACIKRDEAFFRSKAKWNCGWHICSVCQKTSHYMCYTCTYSLCKGCTKNADFACVRENKGLCGLCMRTIMLIEKPAEANKTMCEVDFDDKGSWEYLFKVYWVCLKEKLSLTLDDLLRAKNPWKGPAPISCKVETPHELHHLKDDKGSGSDNSCIDVETDYLENKNPKRQRFIWDGVSNYVGCNTQDLPTTRELTGYVCIKNQVNHNDVAVGDSTSVRVVKSEASGVALDVSSLLFSAGMEQPYNDFVNDKWHYRDPTGKVQGPFSMLQLYKWNSSGHFPPDLRIWRIDERQDNAILLTDALSGKFSKNVPLPYNSQQLSPEASATLVNKDNIQVGWRNETGTGIHTDSQIVKQSDVQMVDDPCTQSNGKDESVWSNGLHSHSPSWTVTADGNNNEGQSGNFERREQSSKCEISCHDQPHSLPSTAFLEKLNENPSETLREGQGGEGNSEDNGNNGSNGSPEGQNNSGQSCQKQSDSEENSGQSSGQSWECPNIHTSMWQAIFGEPTDFSSLVDESVSDLLAEVEAMESLGGMESPTSIMKCDEELTGDPKEMTLEFALGISPMGDAGKGDSLSSTADLHLPSQPTAAEEPFRHADVHNHHQRIPGEQASRSSEVESTFSRISWNPTNPFPWDPKC